MYRLSDRDGNGSQGYKVYMGTVYESKEEWESRDLKEFTTFPSINTSMSPYMSPVDGSMIHNSKDLRAHNTRNNVIDVGNEFKGKRTEYMKKQDIDNSMVATGDEFFNKAQQEILND